DVDVVAVGRCADLFAGCGLADGVATDDDRDGMSRTLAALAEVERGVILVELSDCDARYGHRRDPDGYYAALQQFDRFIPSLRERLGPRDLAVITADHGTDPTFRGSDHTREAGP